MTHIWNNLFDFYLETWTVGSFYQRFDSWMYQLNKFDLKQLN